MHGKEFYDQRKSLGLCPRCGNAVIGRVICLPCLAKQKLDKLGLPPQEIEKARIAFVNFNGLCQCCGSLDPGGTKGWCIDHDHIRKIFRGIICQLCNLMLSRAHNQIEYLEAGIRYVRKFSL